MPTISSRSPTGCAETKPLARGIAPRTGWGDGAIVARRSDAPHDLPVGFRGYDRASTDALLAKLDERAAALPRERDDLRRQVDDLTRDVEEYRHRSDAVADALVTAQRIALDLRANAEARDRRAEAGSRRLPRRGRGGDRRARPRGRGRARQARRRRQRDSRRGARRRDRDRPRGTHPRRPAHRRGARCTARV